MFIYVSTSLEPQKNVNIRERGKRIICCSIHSLHIRLVTFCQKKVSWIFALLPIDVNILDFVIMNVFTGVNND